LPRCWGQSDVKNRATSRRQDHLTFRGNLSHTRYGWLRLTPAYSVHQVESLLTAQEKDAVVFDPFCGTGTTALVCAERGLACDTTDINPFLIWLARVKADSYTEAELDAFAAASHRIAEAIRSNKTASVWSPPLHQIDKWWGSKTLHALGQAMACIKVLENALPARAGDLLKIAFCRTMMEHAHVSFGHQSMSFKKRRQARETDAVLPGVADNPVAAAWEQAASTVASAARSPIVRPPHVLLLDARFLEEQLAPDRYSCVITSPPYPNRMSYVRELRPYMYWLGYLRDGRQAGELDWQAIGGTWGCATSNLTKWMPPSNACVPFNGFAAILGRISDKSDVLSRYVHKYFLDMAQHCRGLFRSVKPGGAIHYIVGNSKFYDVLLPVEELFAALFEAAGFTNVKIKPIRKRTSKKELFEFVVSARKPSPCGTTPGLASVSTPASENVVRPDAIPRYNDNLRQLADKSSPAELADEIHASLRRMGGKP